MPTLTKPAPPPPPPPPTPHRTDPALRQLLVWVVAIFALGCVLSGALVLIELASRQTETVRTSYPGVKTLKVDAGASDVSIVQGAPGAAVRVAARITRSFTAPDRHDRVQNGVLTLASDCDIWLGGSCGVDYSVTVPPDTRVVTDVGSGDVSIAGLQARSALVVRGGSGDLELRDTSAPSLDVRVGSGDVAIDGLRSPLVTAEIGSGDLALALETAPERLRAMAGSGDIALTVPAAPSYRIAADAGSGDVTSDDALANDDRSPRQMLVTTGSGDIDLHAGR